MTPFSTINDFLQDPIQSLHQIYKEESRHMLSGYLPNSFDLKVTHGEINLSMEIEPFGQPADSLSDDFYSKNAAAAIRKEYAEYLEELFDGGAISGYGDIETQSNQVNSEVRNAREIPTGHFKVTKSLYKDIERIWGENFLPGSVRVEPYKIHLYGPGGCFKPHYDTPEKDLVGTFLVGIGDCTTGNSGNLRVGRETGMRAYPGSFVAFYPDIEHEVVKLKGGYRAVIAFKIFRKQTFPQKSPSKFKPRTDFEKRVLEKMTQALTKLTPPYGILLQHRYSVETTELSGMDNLLYSAASSHLTSSAEVHFLPILLHFKSRVPEVWDPYNGKPVPAKAHIFPLTQFHIVTLVAETSSNNRNPGYLSKREKELNQDMPDIVYHSTWHDDDSWHDDESDDHDDSDDSSASLDSGSETKAKKGKAGKNRSEHKLQVDVSDTPYAWLRHCKDVPFYSLQKGADKVTWSASLKAGDAEYYGNESRPDSADSIYLSYAMVAVPTQKRKRGN